MEKLQAYVKQCGNKVHAKIQEGAVPSEEQLSHLIAGIVTNLKDQISKAPDCIKQKVESPWMKFWDFEANSASEFFCKPSPEKSLDKLLQILGTIRDSLERVGDDCSGKGSGKGLALVQGAPTYRGPPVTPQPKQKSRGPAMTPQPKQKSVQNAKKPRYGAAPKVPFDPGWLVEAAEKNGDRKLAAALRQCTSGWWETPKHAYFHFVDPHTDAWKFDGNKEVDGDELVVLDVLRSEDGDLTVGGIEFVYRL